MRLILGWYFHLPPCFTDAELHACADVSLDLLLRAHETSRVPFVLAVTGHTLELIRQHRPAYITRLRHLIDDGIVIPAATTYYEVVPHLIPPSHLAAHIDTDLELKRRVFDRTPTLFWPGNFCWSPVMAPLLTERAISTVLLDQAHLASTASTQTWQWRRGASPEPHSRLADTGCSDEDCLRPYRLADPGSAPLELLFRSSWAHGQLTFGVEAALHRPWDTAPLDTFAADAARMLRAGENRVLFFGDDGDRISPVSYHPYTRLLASTSALTNSPGGPFDAATADHLEYLCPYAPPELADPADVAVRAYLNLLDEIHLQVALGRIQPSEVLPLQDVFPLFWRRIGRTAWFYRRAFTLLKECGVLS